MIEHVSDDELLEAIEAAVEAEERDLCAGGVPPVKIEERVELSVSQVRERCKDLVEEGRLEEVPGVAPETYRPRTGFLPPQK